jgi:DNA-binding NarL/FixJ family response regulator
MMRRFSHLKVQMKNEAHEITLVVADDHRLVREAIVALLKNEADFRVVGEASDGFEALRLVEAKRPDILLLDLSLPGVHGLEVVRQVCGIRGKTKRGNRWKGKENVGGFNGMPGVIVVSMQKAESSVIEALRNGASGYVLKDSNGFDLVEAVRKVKLGRKYLSPYLADLAVNALAQKVPDEASDAYDLLSERERLVLQIAAEGHHSTEIASRLFISPRTAQTHRANFMRKLSLHSQTDLVRFAVRRNIIAM